MSQENVEIVRRLYDEFLARPERVMDPAIVQFFDPNGKPARIQGYQRWREALEATGLSE